MRAVSSRAATVEAGRRVGRRSFRLNRPLALAVVLVAGLSIGASAQTGPPPAEKVVTPPAKAAVAPPPAPVVPAAPVLPAPKLTDAELRYFAAQDKAIAATRDLAVSEADAARVREGSQAVGANDPNRARTAADAMTLPAGRLLVTWIRLRGGYGEPAEYKSFLAANPDWPDRGLLVQRMEEAIFLKGGTARSIRDLFDGSEPQTGPGFAALASAFQAEGNIAKAKELASRAWRDLRIPTLLEKGFLERFATLLDPADHKWRLDRLIIDDIRWTGERVERGTIARRVVALLPETERARAEARLAVFHKSANAPQMLAALPADAEVDWGLLYHRAQSLRRQGKRDEAAKLMLTAPVDPKVVPNLDDWWEERRAIAYGALDAGNAQLAYKLVKDAGPLSVNPLKDQQFVAGWIAFRDLKNPRVAIEHFKALAKAADGPLSRAKAAYWQARCEEVLGNASAARGHYEVAARNIDTFHGLLARQRLAPDSQRLVLGLPAEPTAANVAKFANSTVVQAAVIARASNLETAVIRNLLTQASRQVLTMEAEIALAAHLAEAFGDTQLALRIGKAGVARGQNLLVYAYPVHPFPAYTPLRSPPEAAFMLSIARQESEFNPTIVSGAGARGLLQVMPITAKHVCTDYRLKCDVKRLLTDRSYNAMMASAYIGDRMRDFGGSYVLTLAGYNAGPGRARQWITAFGDPRSDKVDVLDWIERIPFLETREYVGKVLSNIQIYRARLGEEETALRLVADLNRARGSVVARPEQLPARPAAVAAPEGDIFEPRGGQ